MIRLEGRYASPHAGSQVCALDLQGIVAKPKISPYRLLGTKTPWLKIKNPEYSQAEGRDELFNEAT